MENNFLSTTFLLVLFSARPTANMSGTAIVPLTSMYPSL